MSLRSKEKPAGSVLQPEPSPPTFLMCPPDHFGIDTDRNPWLASRRVPRRDEARRQWTTLRDTLVGLGARVSTVRPAEGLPGLIFTANAGFVFGNQVVLSRFRDPRRRGETHHFERWFEQHGYRVLRLPRGVGFEGQGEMRWVGAQLLAGYHSPADLIAHRWIEEQFEVPVLSLRLADSRFYHLDTSLCPLGSGRIAFFPPAFTPEAQGLLARTLDQTLELAFPDAIRFAANAVLVGKTAVIAAGCDGFGRILEEAGIETRALPLSQFRLEGGGAKCLVLDLNEGPETARIPGSVGP